MLTPLSVSITRMPFAASVLSRTSVLTAILAGTLGNTLPAQDRPPLELQRLTRPIAIDGTPNEAAWQEIRALPLTMYTPRFRGEPTQRTVIRVAYDDEALYAAGWFYDTEPSGIRINSLYRDRWNGDDALAIYIDTFNDNRNAKWFGITAAGMRFDQLLSDDGATFNGSWDTFWTAKSTVTDSGWFSEVRIPFSSLGFHADKDGKAVMGLTVTRLISRLDERVTFPEIDPKFEFRRPSLAQDVVLRDVRSRRPLYITPYALTGSGQTAVPVTGEGFRTNRRTTREIGLDVRYPLSGDLTLDLTVNTDFAQVEADDQQVNLDRFPLFFPERRRFFQEGSGTFDFATAGGSRLFNSRRIGIAPDFASVPVRGGARLVGRAGLWDIGALGMQTQSLGTTPVESFGVLRLRRPVFNAFSTAGLMLTSYAGGGHHNLALGADGSFRVRGDDYFTLKWAATSDDRDSASSTVGDRSLFDAKWERRTGRGLQYNLTMSRANKGYRPELGFMPRQNYTVANAYGNWFIFTDSSRYFRRVYPGALAFSTFRNADGALESSQYAVWVQWDTKTGGGGWVEPKGFHESVLTPFTIGKNITIPAGSYDFADLQLVWTMPTGQRMRTGIDFRSGTYFDGRRTQVVFTPTWNQSSHLELGADYQVSLLNFPERNQSEEIHVARLRIRAALDAQKSGNAFVQYNSTTNRLDLNVRFRYAFVEGTDLWLVYNEGLGTERERDPLGVRAPLSLARTLIVKYSHTFGY
ncbi:MAG: DUF5916 domain-containing protein [Gemmatimonadaceae bacterium]